MTTVCVVGSDPRRVVSTSIHQGYYSLSSSFMSKRVQSLLLYFLTLLAIWFFWFNFILNINWACSFVWLIKHIECAELVTFTLSNCECDCAISKKSMTLFMFNEVKHQKKTIANIGVTFLCKWSFVSHRTLWIIIHGFLRS